MDKKERNDFYINNISSINNIIDYAIRNSGYDNIIANYLNGRVNGNDDFYIANMHVNREDIKQQLLLEIFEVLKKKQTVNLSYIKMLCENRLKNIFRKYYNELEKSLPPEELQKEKDDNPDPFDDSITVEIYTKMVIEITMLKINDSLEKKYLELLAGNLNIKDFQKYAIQKKSKGLSDDKLIASELGFDNPKNARYCKVKKKVKEYLAEVLKSMDDAA